MFPVKIKYINYQVVSTNLMLETLYSGGVHFVEPACKQENIDNVQAKKDDGFAYSFVQTNGYGYIGINAEKVPTLEVRQAIMHAINTQLAVQYYNGYSYSIYRPMTLASWAYPRDYEPAQKPYYPFDPDGTIIDELMDKAGYSLNSDNVWQKNIGGSTHVCKYVFTIAGDTTDHPAYNSLKQAAEILNAHGFDIEVKTDINALSKLNNGDLTVWAAAWGAGVDPDMYQVYHIDSTAGSTANWGYRAIKRNNGGVYDTELDMIEELSEIIDQARETLDENRRKELYAQALDMVMALAVELPTYQRSDLFAYNSSIIDASTLTSGDDLTSYNGPLSRIWEVSLKETNPD
jgi:peptide/nickel transport system substrate-binding protein